MTDLRQGDVVCLNGSATHMAVLMIIGVEGNPPMWEEPYKLGGYKATDVVCQWHEKTKLRTQCFPRTMLHKIEKP